MLAIDQELQMLWVFIKPLNEIINWNKSRIQQGAFVWRKLSAERWKDNEKRINRSSKEKLWRLHNIAFCHRSHRINELTWFPCLLRIPPRLNDFVSIGILARSTPRPNQPALSNWLWSSNPYKFKNTSLRAEIISTRIGSPGMRQRAYSSSWPNVLGKYQQFEWIGWYTLHCELVFHVWSSEIWFCSSSSFHVSDMKGDPRRAVSRAEGRRDTKRALNKLKTTTFISLHCSLHVIRLLINRM